MSARLQRLFKKCRARRNESDKENNFARAFRFEKQTKRFSSSKGSGFRRACIVDAELSILHPFLPSKRFLFLPWQGKRSSANWKLAFRIEASVIVGCEARFAALPSQKSTFITPISLHYHMYERGLSYNNTRDTSKDFAIVFVQAPTPHRY